MNALNTAEAGIPEEVYAGWRVESGHQAEENFLTAMGNLNVEILQRLPDEAKSKKLVETERIAVMRTSGKEDFEEGIDFYIFSPYTGEMVPVDLSTAVDRDVRNRKQEKEEEGGPRFLSLGYRELQLAAQSKGFRKGEEASRDLDRVWRGVNILLFNEAIDQARRGHELVMPRERFAEIERQFSGIQ
jgi:hypothetical protein